MTKNKEKSGNHGFTLIELIVALSILSVTGLMSMTLLGVSSRMYHSSVSMAELQLESQSVSRFLSAAMMDARSLYILQGEKDTLLFTGTAAEASDGTTYTGELFWWDKEQASLYHTAHASIKEEKDSLSAASAREYFLGGAGAGEEYLLSKRLKGMELQTWEGEYTTLKYSLTFSYKEGQDYTLETSVSGRNRLDSYEVFTVNK